MEEKEVRSLIAEGENERIEFKRELDLMKSGKEGERGEMEEQAKSIFVGHGRSPVWRELKDFLQDRLNLKWDEFNRQSVAGFTTKERLNEMLDQACFAFLIMTAEDEHVDQTKHARENVIHEAGLFQGRLGFEKAIILLEQGCTEFSNIQGVQQIRFPPGNIKAVFEDIRLVLEREKILRHDALERPKVPTRAVMLGPTPSTDKEMRQHRWEKLSLERIANDPGPLEKRYPGLPLGERQLNGVPFVLSTKYFSLHRMPAHVDIPVELRLDESLERVGSVHVLIIGGNVYKQHQGTPLERVTIGRIQLIFHDKSSQEPKKLIVGENIREWVPGNRPGELVDSVTEQLCQVAWRGKDSSGKEIFIDHLNPSSRTASREGP
jgi:predicted nucleotide-binding protein